MTTRSIIRNNSGKGVPSSKNGGQAAFHVRDEPAELILETDMAVEAAAEPVVDTDVFGNPLGRGGFARDGRGSALVVTTDPENDVYKSGPKKGLPKTYAYKSASGFAVSTSTAGLETWKQNKLLLAMIRDHTIGDRLAEAMGDLDPDSPEGKKVFSAFRDEMHEIAETDMAARRGTFSHWLTETTDLGESPLEGLREGEALGIDNETAARIMEGWEAINREYGLESVAVETKLVNDELKAAGTTDRISRLTKPLTFDLGDGPVTLLPGDHIIVDFKSGKLRQDAKGNPQFWEKYTSQLAAYAGSKPYNPREHQRMNWSDIGVSSTPSQKVGIIIHGDLEALADGTSDRSPREAFSVFALDLVKGREYALASVALTGAERNAGKAFAAVKV